ncbi:MAG: restriction endonuclease subunit S [Burkholderiales bacterium]|nr:restriction endonuclease subunit S [Burkholderiales bacterium]
MTSNYKPIGNYIQRVEERNNNLKVTRLLGLSMTKEFRETTSNIVGTDMSVYKVMRKYQFACDFMSPIRVNKLPVVLKLDDEPNLVSPAYPVFEVKDKNELDPEYLMMWFRRSEFDRFVTFKCDAAIRGGYDWEELCQTLIPVPHIDKQREIVKEYNIIQNRIILNQQLIKKLEETAQTIYKQWFVEFEFPDENGNPYKSNGGEMVDSELGEIPQYWERKEISTLCEITSSKRIFENEYQKKGIPFYRGKEITQKKAGEVISNLIFISPERYNQLVKNYGKPNNGDILMTAVGTIGSTYMVVDEQFYFKDGNVIWFKNFKQEKSNYYVYDFMQTEQFKNLLDEITIGSTQSAITIKTFGQQKIIFPVVSVLDRYVKISMKLNNYLFKKKQQQVALNQLKNLLLSKLAQAGD